MRVEANIVDIRKRQIYHGTIHAEGKHIAAITHHGPETDGLPYALPGFIDAHVHIESSMLVPDNFGRLAITHGTVATVSDPHEIANVLGIAGVDFMIERARVSPVKIFFGAPSCVPATGFETAGAEIDSASVSELLAREEIWYLSEMMNYPGVLNDDSEVMAKIRAAERIGKPVDGHAPGLQGDDAVRYIKAGISTDHECTTYEEAEWKLRNGMKIIIREGSAARNFDALYPLIDEYPDAVMFCSDDKHPDDLVVGHINLLVRRAVAEGADLFNVLRAACVNPVMHYKLPVGLLRSGDLADFIMVNNLDVFTIEKVFIEGQEIPDMVEKAVPVNQDFPLVNNFGIVAGAVFDLSVKGTEGSYRVIGAVDGSIVTKDLQLFLRSENGCLQPSVPDDVLKICVINRYSPKPAAVAFVHGFGMTKGAIASSVAHYSHNIVAVGCTDEELSRVIKMIVKAKGGIAATDGATDLLLELPVAGLMSDRDAVEVADHYGTIDRFVRNALGSSLGAPFMTLSFMALLVIPSLKLSDKGLFDGTQFRFVNH